MSSNTVFRVDPVSGLCSITKAIFSGDINAPSIKTSEGSITVTGILTLDPDKKELQAEDVRQWITDIGYTLESESCTLPVRMEGNPSIRYLVYKEMAHEGLGYFNTVYSRWFYFLDATGLPIAFDTSDAYHYEMYEGDDLISVVNPGAGVNPVGWIYGFLAEGTLPNITVTPVKQLSTYITEPLRITCINNSSGLSVSIPINPPASEIEAFEVGALYVISGVVHMKT